MREREREGIPSKGGFSCSCLAAGGMIYVVLTPGLACCGGAPALCIPCESHHTNGARAPAW